MKKSTLAHLAVFIAMVIYGANYVIMKKVTPNFVEPFGLVVYRAVIACIMFFVTGIFIREKISRQDILKIALLGVFGVLGNQILFIKGLSLTSPINAAIMMLTSPILVVVLAMVFKREKTDALKIIGIILGMLGAILVILKGTTTAKSFSSNPTGDMLILINALSWGLYLIFAKPLMAKYHTITVVKWVFLFGSLYTIPLGYTQASKVEFNSFDSETWFNFLYVIIATTYLAYLLNTYSLKVLSSSVVSAYIYLQPVLAAVFGLMYGIDQLSLWCVIGALIVFAGVYMVSFNRR